VNKYLTEVTCRRKDLLSSWSQKFQSIVLGFADSGPMGEAEHHGGGSVEKTVYFMANMRQKTRDEHGTRYNFQRNLLPLTGFHPLVSRTSHIVPPAEEQAFNT
jgi:hypothetical protein